MVTIRVRGRWNGVPRTKQGVFTALRSKQELTCFLFAFLIAAMSYVFAFTGGNFKALVFTQAIFVIWVIFVLVFKRERARFSAYGILSLLILGSVLSCNLLVNYDNYGIADKSLAFSAVHIAGILVFGFAAQWANSDLKPDHIFEYMAWMFVPLVIWALVVGWTKGGSERLALLGIHPNWWGEMAFGFVICVLAMRKIYAKILFIMIALVLMYMVQSRGALLGATVSLLSYWVLQYRPLGKAAMKRLAISGGLFLGVAMFVLVMGWWPTIVNFVELKVLFLNDSYRGLGTGLTGRLAGWRDAVAIFIENPIFGQGFGTLPKVHNGFLQWLGEGGILLFGVISMMIASAMVRAWRRRNDLVFAALLGIMAYMMTFPRGLNLNIVGVIFLFTLFPWKCQRTINGSTWVAKMAKWISD